MLQCRWTSRCSWKMRRLLEAGATVHRKISRCTRRCYLPPQEICDSLSLWEQPPSRLCSQEIIPPAWNRRRLEEPADGQCDKGKNVDKREQRTFRNPSASWPADTGRWNIFLTANISSWQMGWPRGRSR